MKRSSAFAISLLLLTGAAYAQDRRIRIFLTGNDQTLGNSSNVSAAEIGKSLDKHCADVVLTIQQEKAEYLLQARDTGAGAARKPYKFTLFDQSGDRVFSTETSRLDSAVKDVCVYVRSIKGPRFRPGYQVEIETQDKRLVIVLGTSHALQMAENRADREYNVDDPLYTKLIQRFTKCFGIPVDSIFEEASGCGPTAAEKLARDLGLKYVDVDPPPGRRHLYGLCSETGESLDEPFDLVRRTFADRQSDRERFWAERIRKEQFQSALMICGLLHTLSLSEKLISAGFEVFSYCYAPHDRLCHGANVNPD
jgi:hypothetical protein